tara:strand:- start:1 stop:117 length:117 start_codon:yes stop_codon:yes gene_type:complete
MALTQDGNTPEKIEKVDNSLDLNIELKPVDRPSQSAGH